MMARSELRQLDPWMRIWLGCGALWSLGLVLVKRYSSSHGPGRSLVEGIGLKVLLVLSMPLVDVAIVALALQRRRRARGVGVLVWLVFGLLALLGVLGALSIGPFIGRVGVLVILAIVRAKSQSMVSEQMPR